MKGFQSTKFKFPLTPADLSETFFLFLADRTVFCCRNNGFSSGSAFHVMYTSRLNFRFPVDGLGGVFPKRGTKILLVKGAASPKFIENNLF